MCVLVLANRRMVITFNVFVNSNTLINSIICGSYITVSVLHVTETSTTYKLHALDRMQVNYLVEHNGTGSCHF